MIATLKLALIFLALLDGRITTLDGKEATGTINAIDSQQAVLTDADGNAATIKLEDISGVAFSESKPTDESDFNQSQTVQLADGSIISAASISATAETLSATLSTQSAVNIARSSVRAIRLLPLEDAFLPQWNAFLERSNTKDMLIVSKRDGTGLDFLAGIVVSMGADEIPFLLDGDEIPVPRARVLGIVFAASDKKQNSLKGSIRIGLMDGSQILARNVSLENQQLQLETSWGQRMSVTIEAVHNIDFSGSRVHYLSDLETLTERYFGLDPAGKEWGDLFESDRETRTGLSGQWRMSRDSFPNSGRPPLTLRGRQFRKGLCIFPSARIEYALDGQYSRFQASVGIDDEVAFNQLSGKKSTAVELRIEADGEEIFSQLIHGPDEAIDLDLNMTGVNTLSLLVDFGDGSSTCDYLDLGNARLLVDNSKK